MNHCSGQNRDSYEGPARLISGPRRHSLETSEHVTLQMAIIGHGMEY